LQNRYVYARVGFFLLSWKGVTLVRNKHTNQARACLTIPALLLLATWAVWTIPEAMAQNTPVELRFKIDQNDDFVEPKEIKLRPNTDRTVFLFVKNQKADEILKNLSIKLLKVEANGSASVVQQTTLDLDKGETKQIMFAPDKDAKEPKEDKKDKKDEGIVLAGPPFEFQVLFEQADYKAKTEMLPIYIMEPREYVAAAGVEYDPVTATLAIKVANLRDNLNKAKHIPIYGPPCFIKLDLQRAWIPGLIPVKTTGVYQQVLLPVEDRSGYLRAEKLQFESDPPEVGRVHLDADGYERAFIFETNFKLKNVSKELGQTGEAALLRLVTARFAQPGPKMLVKVQADNPPNVVSRFDPTKPRPKPLLIKLELDLEGTGQFFVPINELPGHRQQIVTFNPAGPGGSLLLRNTIKDWEVELDTTDLFGVKKVRAQLLVYNGVKGEYERAPLVSEKGKGGGFLDAEVGDLIGELTYEDNTVLATFTLDSTPPEIEILTGNLKETDKDYFEGRHLRGEPLKMLVRIDEPPPLSPTREVIFFLGAPTPKNTIPDGAPQVKAEREKDAPVWLARLPIDSSKAGMFDIGVLAVNQAGLSNTKTIKLILVDAPKDGGGPDGEKLAKITGSVVVGGLPQPDVQVTLSDAKGEVKGATKTLAKPAGAFILDKVKPGVYTVIAANPALKVQGQAIVQVPEGVEEVKNVQIEMKR
jgi:hypothetical protein